MVLAARAYCSLLNTAVSMLTLSVQDFSNFQRDNLLVSMSISIPTATGGVYI